MVEKFMALMNEFIIVFFAFVIILTFRGFFKSVIALLNGDDTPMGTGFISLNPLAQVDLFPLVTVLFLVYMVGGYLDIFAQQALLWLFVLGVGARWAYPIPINQQKFWHQTLGMVVTLLSGACSGFVLAWLFMYVRMYTPFQSLPQAVSIPLKQIIRTIISYSIFFSVLDLIPIPPFNTGYLLLYSLPPSCTMFIYFLEEYAVYLLATLFFCPGISDVFFAAIFFLSHSIEHILISLVF